MNFTRVKAKHLKLGRRGEKIAAKLLYELGLDIIICNYENDVGEIDIVAVEGDVLCFIEVKTRRRLIKYRPADSVNLKKQAKIMLVADTYLHGLHRKDVKVRFDVVEVICGNWFIGDIWYHRGAFGKNPD